MENIVFDLLYILSAVLFIVGLKKLSQPATSSKGNSLAAIGMGLAILVSLFVPIEGNQNYIWIIVALILGGVIGIYAAKKVQMTAMPEMVSVFNGLGGACAAIISIIELKISIDNQLFTPTALLVVLSTLVIGGLSFTGSMIAYGKLNGSIKDFKILFNQYLNYVMNVVIVITVTYVTYNNSIDYNALIFIIVLSLLYGVTFVMPVGGADMPVVISLLNSFTGITSLLAGIVYSNYIMILGGILVGSSGIILTLLMCKAMNRSLMNVLIGSFSANISSSNTDQNKIYKTITLDDASVIINYSQKLVIVPGYGMAVAQAQKICKDIETILVENGVNVKYAIHPVAGRMPGHMNILLAEANVEYDKLMDLEEANEFLKNTDTAIVVGANDVVNPLAIEDPSSSIYGMPILDLRTVKQVIILKRSMSTGYAGIDNSLFYKENTKMLFGDAKKTLQSILSEIKEMN